MFELLKGSETSLGHGSQEELTFSKSLKIVAAKGFQSSWSSTHDSQVCSSRSHRSQSTRGSTNGEAPGDCAPGASVLSRDATLSLSVATSSRVKPPVAWNFPPVDFRAVCFVRAIVSVMVGRAKGLGQEALGGGGTYTVAYSARSAGTAARASASRRRQQLLSSLYLKNTSRRAHSSVKQGV